MMDEQQSNIIQNMENRSPKTATTTKRGKWWSVTCFNIADELLFQNALFSYSIFGRETCPKTKKDHLQGAVRCCRAVSFSSIKSIFKDAHIEHAMHPKELVEYCKKDGNYKEHGTPVFSGQRTDLDAIIQLVKEEKTLYEIRELEPKLYMIHRDKIMNYMNDCHIPKMKDKLQVIWHYGDSGSGKTYSIYKTHNLQDIYSYRGNGRFFCGYQMQKIALFDDLRPDRFTITDLLQLLDKYPITVEVKGSHVPWLAETIYITTICPPREFFRQADAKEQAEQLLRRIHKCYHFIKFNNEFIMQEVDKYFASSVRLDLPVSSPENYPTKDHAYAMLLTQLDDSSFM